MNNVLREEPEGRILRHLQMYQAAQERERHIAAPGTPRQRLIDAVRHHELDRMQTGMIGNNVNAGQEKRVATIRLVFHPMRPRKEEIVAILHRMTHPVDGDDAEAGLNPEGHTAFDIWTPVRSSGLERRIIGMAYDRISSRV